MGFEEALPAVLAGQRAGHSRTSAVEAVVAG